MDNKNFGKSGWIIFIVGTIIILIAFGIIMINLSPENKDEGYIKSTLGTMFEEECGGSEGECRVAAECAAGAFTRVLTEKEIEEFAKLLRAGERSVAGSQSEFMKEMKEDKKMEYWRDANACVSEIDYGMGMLTPFIRDEIYVE